MTNVAGSARQQWLTAFFARRDSLRLEILPVPPLVLPPSFSIINVQNSQPSSRIWVRHKVEVQQRPVGFQVCIEDLLLPKDLELNCFAGSALEKRLNSEGMLAQEESDIINHVISHQTAGSITRLIWKGEHSLLQHEYLLICIAVQDEPGLSWVRLERMGNVGDKATKQEPAQLTFILAPTMDSLSHQDDKTICDADLRLSDLTLVDTAHVVSIIHQTASDYTFLHHNCWWFARQTFRVLISKFMSNGAMKRQLLSRCEWKELEHAEAPYHSPWRGRLVRGGLLLITFPVFPLAWPVIIGGTLGISGYTTFVLRKTARRVDTQVEEYLRKKACRSQ